MTDEGRTTEIARTDADRLSTILFEHQTHVSVMGGWSAKFGKEALTRYGWSCSCGAHSPEPFVVYLTIEEAEAGRHLHVACAAETIVSAARADERDRFVTRLRWLASEMQQGYTPVSPGSEVTS